MSEDRPKPEGPQIAAARIEVERSRARLVSTAHELQERVSPRTLARDAWEGARTKGVGLAEDAADAVRARPVASGGAAAGVALFLARRPLKSLFGKLFRRRSRDDDDAKGAKNTKNKKTEKVE